MANRRLVLAALASLAAGWSFASCGAEEPGLEPQGGVEGPVLLLGVDGLEWRLLLPLLRAGELPVLEGLMARGAYGNFETQVPTWSPRLWTTMATGKNPSEHGIEDFVHYDEEHNPLALFTSEDRRVKAHWNMLSDAGIDNDTIGWWMTFPVEPVDGLMVAQTNAPIEADGSRQGPEKGILRAGVPAQVHPPAAEAGIFAQLGAVEAGLDATLESIFGALEPYDEQSAARWSDCRWAFRADNTYLAIALERAARPGGPAAVTSLYLGGTDVVGHRFFAAHRPKPFGLAAEHAEVTTFGSVIPDYYRFVDASIGRLLEAWPADTTVLLVSDHGMSSAHKEVEAQGGLWSKRRDRMGISRTGGHPRGEAGVLLAAGPGIRADFGAGRKADPRQVVQADLASVGGLLDLLPTLLTLVGLPAGEDMPGAPMSALLDPSLVALPRIASHDDADWRTGRVKTGIQPVDSEGRIGQLGDLGYLDGQ